MYYLHGLLFEWFSLELLIALFLSEYSSWKDFRILSVDSQKKQFQDFLLRANKYPALSISGKGTGKSVPGKKIILVEDIPNTFYRNIKDFHEILRSFHATSRNPLVFIISDSFIGENSLYSLFPKTLKLELKITSISFNAVVNSIMMKTINKIVDVEAQLNAKNFKLPSKDMLDLLVSSANGDIRACINSLQFYCTNESASTMKYSTSSKNPVKYIPASKSKGKLEALDDSTALSFGRDTPLFLFRALGKILYCKRESVKEDRASRPNELHHFARGRLLIDPEDIIEKTHVQYDTFNLYLHQNFLGFYNNIDDVANASKYFSDADIVTGRWSTRETLQAYSSSIAARGVIFSNCSRSNSTTGAVSGGWRQLHKPQWFEAFKEGNLNKRTAEDLFYDLRHPAVDLHTEVLPFIAKSNVPLRTPSHIAFVQMISRFNIYTSRSSSTLDQNENGTSDEIAIEEQSENDKTKTFKPCEDETESLSQILVETQQSSEDTNNFEECLIEDFSDEDDFAELLLV